jgi:hypothetical protein
MNLLFEYIFDLLLALKQMELCFFERCDIFTFQPVNNKKIYIFVYLYLKSVVKYIIKKNLNCFKSHKKAFPNFTQLKSELYA